MQVKRKKQRTPTTQIAKVPVVIQMEMLECGAASLCMVLAYYGKWLPLEKVRIDSGVSRDGSSAKNILRAARGYGLDAAGYRMEPSDLRKIRYPAIIHWNFNHFVVLNGFKKGKAVINDPAKGTVEVSLEDLDRSFTGIVLQFEPTKQFAPEGQPRSVLNFAWKRLKGSLSAIYLVMAISVVSAMVGLATPLFAKIFMDEILSGKNPEWLIPFTLAYALLIFTTVANTTIQSLGWLRINGRFAITASAEFIYHVLRLPMDFFAQRWAGDIASRQAANEGIASQMIRKLAPAVVNLTMIVFYLVIMLRYSLLLTLIGIVTALANLFIGRWTARKIQSQTRVLQDSHGKLSGATVSGIEMIETIKSSGSENGYFERWAGYYTRFHNAQTRINRTTALLGIVPALLNQAVNILILSIGVAFIMAGQFTIGMLMAFQGYLGSFMNPVNKFISLGQILIALKTDLERVEDVLDYPVDGFDSAAQGEAEQANPSPNGDASGRGAIPLAPDAMDMPGKLFGELEIRNLNFGYSRLGDPLIQDFSLHLGPGQTVALVGGSGCGKSTLAKLVTGLYEPWSGEILFDGKPRSAIDPYVFRSSVAMVDQEITLFEDTISNNIRMWDTSIEEFAVIMAARDADIHDVVVSRPDGYSQTIQEGGKNFSGGQRQRLEIARVLASEPTIIVLDEATSALDSKTEHMVMNNIRNLGGTCIIIAHRLSTVRDCDEIIVLDKGRVVERGTHDELIAMSGSYSQLVTTD
ncbi:MAG: NHLP family bacteriocin export ABC transporter peptidase/permease/ATPase subunit [Eubacteriales bacterium]|nr:NHLP family bacteriocin export ABC transporter peptidase/permease/ATPase subunit [Eubacteriales bacterium]